MKTICIILLLFDFAYSQELLDELATINGAGKSISIRSKPDKSSEIVGQLHADDIFYYSPSRTKDGWCLVFYDIDTASISKADRANLSKHFKISCNSVYVKGYIPENEIQLLSKLPEISFEKVQKTETSIYLQNDSITFFLSSETFAPSKHKLSEVCYWKYVDGLRAWGTDPGSSIPMTQISSIKLALFGKEIQFPASEYSNLYEPNFDHFYFYLDKNGGLFFHMENSDGAGVYDAVFLIRNGTCKLIFVNLNPYV